MKHTLWAALFVVVYIFAVCLFANDVRSDSAMMPRVVCTPRPLFVWNMPNIGAVDDAPCMIAKKHAGRTPRIMIDLVDGRVIESRTNTVVFPSDVGFSRFIPLSVYEKKRQDFENTIRWLFKPYCGSATPTNVEPISGVAPSSYPVTVACSNGSRFEVESPTLASDIVKSQARKKR